MSAALGVQAGRTPAEQLLAKLPKLLLRRLDRLVSRRQVGSGVLRNRLSGNEFLSEELFVGGDRITKCLMCGLKPRMVFDGQVLLETPCRVAHGTSVPRSSASLWATLLGSAPGVLVMVGRGADSATGA